MGMTMLASSNATPPPPPQNTQVLQPWPLTSGGAVHPDLTLTGLQPAARHAAQVGGELTHRGQSEAANTVAVG